MSPPRICIILPASGDEWYRDNLSAGFLAIGRALREAGWCVSVIDAEPGDDRLPTALIGGLRRLQLAKPKLQIISGPGSGALTAALRNTHRVGEAVAAEPFDLVLAPLRSGLAQGLLMARATAEAPQIPPVCLWCDAPSAWRLGHDDTALVDIAPLVEDALEREAIRRADVLIAPSQGALVRAAGEMRSHQTHRLARLPSLPPLRKPASDNIASSASIGEIVFVGPASRIYGLPAFLDAVEILAGRGVLAGRRVTFLGPMRDQAQGLSKALLGIRAQDWAFEFKICEVRGPAEAWDRLQRPGSLAVFAGELCDDDVLFASVVAAGLPTIATVSHALADLLVPAGWLCAAAAESLAARIERVLTAGFEAPGPPPPPDWPRLLDELRRQGDRPRRVGAGAPPALSLCITHRDRPACLERALTSIVGSRGPQPEVLIVDNASAGVEAAELLARIERSERPRARIIRLDPPQSQAAACNLAAREASGEIVVFLDDDNMLAEDGLARFAAAFAENRFDVVVTCLDLYDGDPAREAADARLIFLGDAGSAGLFFNGFGDMNMAVRRSRFLSIGGLETAPGSQPALDWVFLAKARAAGLRIGVLQKPAVRYARDLSDVDRKWRKRDQEGARRAVLAAYGGAIDCELVARLAQGLTLFQF
jgi:Glycosyl transferase family 2